MLGGSLNGSNSSGGGAPSCTSLTLLGRCTRSYRRDGDAIRPKGGIHEALKPEEFRVLRLEPFRVCAMLDCRLSVGGSDCPLNQLLHAGRLSRS